MLVTPRKKRALPDSDEEVLTPKKVRIQGPPTPPSTRHKGSSRSLPSHLSRLLELHRTLEQALSIGLATSSSGFTPSAGHDGEPSTKSPTGYMANIVNHIGLATAGQARRCSIEDLSRLVWLWEWDGETLPDSRSPLEAVNDDPFVEIPEEWKRGGMGIIVTQTMHTSRNPPKRAAAYGIGIQVNSFSKSKDMHAIAQWTAGAEKRRKALESHLEAWIELHTKERVKQRENSRASSPTPSPVPNIPFSALPRLPSSPVASASISALGRDLLDATARKPGNRTPTGRVLFPSSSPSTSASTSASSSRPSSPLKPSTLDEPFARPLTPETPRHRDNATPQTPTTSRRAALMERVRLKALSTPSKGGVQITSRNTDGEQVSRTIGTEEMKRRLLLGRLGNVSEAVWMLFSTSPQSPSLNPTAPTRRRRAIPIAEVVKVVIKSAKSPLSNAEAHESLRLLTSICPDFLKSMTIDGEEWLQMAPQSGACPPSPSSKLDDETEVRRRSNAPPSPSSPLRIRARGPITLGDVKERIRKEMDL